MPEQVSPSEMVDEEVIGEPEPETQTSGVGNAQGVLGMLFETEPPAGETPSSLEMDYGVSKGKALFLFGLMKASGSGGMPAIGDMSLGAFLEFQDHTDSGGSKEESTTLESETEQSIDGVPEE